MRNLIFVLLAASTFGCGSTEMASYMGKDTREVMLTSGQPIGAMGMGSGVRAFQFKLGGGSFTIAQTTNTTGQVVSYGSTAWLNSRSITTGGGTLRNEACVMAYLTQWSPKSEGWVVTGYRYPNQLVC